MPRLFITADIPDEARERLAAMSGDLPGAAWIAPEQMHLTVRFIGEVDQSEFLDIRDALAGVRSRSFYLTLKGVGHFPKRGEPEVLWAGVAESQELRSLRNKIESLLVRRGFDPEDRKFHPHITLAKVKDSRAPWVGRYVMENSLFAVHEVPVQSFSLFSSRLAPGGAIHTLENSYPLEGILEAE